MNGYEDIRLALIKQEQAQHRADAGAERLVGAQRRACVGHRRARLRGWFGRLHAPMRDLTPATRP